MLVALHDGERRGRFGGRARLGIPAQADDWPSVAEQLAQGLVKGSERRGARPESMVAYLCQEPGPGESGRDVMERLRSLAQLLRTACGRLDVPVIEALCISDGRFWSYCCPGQGCCSAEGEPMGLPGTSVLAAAATYAGLQVRGSLREFTARLTPWEGAAAREQEAVLDTASMALIPRILDDESRAYVAEEALELARRIMKRLADAPPVSGIRPADLRDDGLLERDEAATLILGLQDRTTRDRAAEWMEGEEAGPALRLWRMLARRCVGAYGEHAAAPSPSPGGSPGRPATNWRPGKPSPWHSAPIPTTSSPVSCTRRATRASTRSRSAAACERSGPTAPGLRRDTRRGLIARHRSMSRSRPAPRSVAAAGYARQGAGERTGVVVIPGRVVSAGAHPPMRPRPPGTDRGGRPRGPAIGRGPAARAVGGLWGRRRECRERGEPAIIAQGEARRSSGAGAGAHSARRGAMPRPRGIGERCAPPNRHVKTLVHTAPVSAAHGTPHRPPHRHSVGLPGRGRDPEQGRSVHLCGGVRGRAAPPNALDPPEPPTRRRARPGAPSAEEAACLCPTRPPTPTAPSRRCAGRCGPSRGERLHRPGSQEWRAL